MTYTTLTWKQLIKAGKKVILRLCVSLEVRYVNYMRACKEIFSKLGIITEDDQPELSHNRDNKAKEVKTMVINESIEVKVSEVLYVTKVRKDNNGRANFGIKVKNLDTGSLEWINCYTIELHQQLGWGKVIRHWNTPGNFLKVCVTNMTTMQFIAEGF